jgi:hypothetical protein
MKVRRTGSIELKRPLLQQVLYVVIVEHNAGTPIRAGCTDIPSQLDPFNLDNVIRAVIEPLLDDHVDLSRPESMRHVRQA